MEFKAEYAIGVSEELIAFHVRYVAIWAVKSSTLGTVKDCLSSIQDLPPKSLKVIAKICFLGVPGDMDGVHKELRQILEEFRSVTAWLNRYGYKRLKYLGNTSFHAVLGRGSRRRSQLLDGKHMFVEATRTLLCCVPNVAEKRSCSRTGSASGIRARTAGSGTRQLSKRRYAHRKKQKLDTSCGNSRRFRKQLGF
eukprot:GHVU01131767.1.p1 GENE.GHVU01131767.1~~GHVU01131767.1.p1  ORF type:complete len:195 (+),score=5.39 GHVU01131767.1:1346-1930(+)